MHLNDGSFIIGKHWSGTEIRMNGKAEGRSRQWMRLAVFAIGGLEAALLLFFVWLGINGLNSTEALGRSISRALVLVYGVPLLVLVAPALVLAVINRWLAFALGLCTIGVAGAAIVMILASR